MAAKTAILEEVVADISSLEGVAHFTPEPVVHFHWNMHLLSATPGMAIDWENRALGSGAFPKQHSWEVVGIEPPYSFRPLI
ncbi:hypothetical protein [Desulfobulbus alkaliphilus]|uniref:hypothetical protein n=1 Tax=Desulfobulbus alkaliphilus TaxID=869814 RepID=UPI0019657D79|nr:hypothetical protein [Desulfobulbus alkaliphilus]MBM9536189.1 hypothetical protein [Desulfobulbus alkaliphilus]